MLCGYLSFFLSFFPVGLSLHFQQRPQLINNFYGHICLPCFIPSSLNVKGCLNIRELKSYGLSLQTYCGTNDQRWWELQGVLWEYSPDTFHPMWSWFGASGSSAVTFILKLLFFTPGHTCISVQFAFLSHKLFCHINFKCGHFNLNFIPFVCRLRWCWKM